MKTTLGVKTGAFQQGRSDTPSQTLPQPFKQVSEQVSNLNIDKSRVGSTTSS